MTTRPQTLRAERSMLAGMPTAASVDDLVRITLDACEQLHEACLQAVQQALKAKRSAPPLHDWLAGASLCRTLAEVLAVEAPEAGPALDTEGAAGQRARLSPWVTGMARLCAELCSELAARPLDDAGPDETAQALRQACADCMQACVRLLAEAGPPGGRMMGSISSPQPSLPSVHALGRQATRPGSLPPPGAALAAA